MVAATVALAVLVVAVFAHVHQAMVRRAAWDIVLSIKWAPGRCTACALHQRWRNDIAGARMPQEHNCIEGRGNPKRKGCHT